MNILESISSAAHSVLANKMRSILTMLGIIIGIAAVIMITSIGQGFQNMVNQSFEALGTGVLQINVRHDRPEPATRSDMLTMDTVEFLSMHPDVTSVAPTSNRNGRVQLRNPTETTNTVFIGTTEAVRGIEDVDLRFGRFLTDVDVSTASPVVVIDSNLARRIFGRVDVVGETIRANFWFGTTELLVVGVFRTQDIGIAMFEMPTIAYIPITTMQNMFNFDTVDTIFVNGRDRERLDQTASEIARLLSVMKGNENRYRVTNLMNQLDMVNDILGAITGFVGLVAFISLVVGGIGVMNIMLVTVTERTREIGIRKSLGATDGNIQFQFLIEAVILTVSGGVIGILLGYYGGFALGGLIDIMPAVSVPTVVGTVIASSLIGIVFGVYPARKAAKLDPIEALRYE